MSRFPLLQARAGNVALRPLQESDSPAVAAACNDELIQRWLPLPSPYTL